MPCQNSFRTVHESSHMVPEPLSPLDFPHKERRSFGCEERSISIIPALYSLFESLSKVKAAFYYHQSSETFFNKSEIDLSGPRRRRTTSIPAGLSCDQSWDDSSKPEIEIQES